MGNQLAASPAARNSFRTLREGCCSQCNSAGEKDALGLAKLASLTFSAWLLHKSRQTGSASISQWHSTPGFLLVVFLLRPLVFQYRYVVWERDFVMPVRLLANCCDWKQNWVLLVVVAQHWSGTWKWGFLMEERSKQQDVGSLIILCPWLTCGSEYIIFCGSDLMSCGCVGKNKRGKICRKEGNMKRQCL